MTISLAAALLSLPVVLVGSRARNADPRVGAGGQDTRTAPVPNRQLRNSMGVASARRPRDPNAPPWRPAPAPATIPIRVTGVARDEAGRPIAGATITLYTITDKGSKPVATATTNAEGRYVIGDAVLPVTTSFGGYRFPKEITPYAGFILSGLAHGLGIAWSPQESMYALKEPHPDDIQGRLPLDHPVALDLIFPKAAVLKGRVVDEGGQPVEGAKLQVLDADLLDDAGHETNNRQGYDWKALPGTVGRAVTASDGGFRIEGLADRACFWISVNRPETDNATMAFYAATIDGPDTTHEELPPKAFNGRGRHAVKTNPITIAFPKIRPIAVTVVGDDTGKPIAGANVHTLNDSLATGIVSGGTTDAAGKVLLGLPPGQYRGISSDPPIETRYIRTYQRPLVVEHGEGAQPYEIRQKAGVELILQAVGTRPGQPVADAFFWKAPEDQPEQTQHIDVSTFRSGEPWTDTKGELRAVLPPEPGRRYRFRFAGIHEPNMPPGINPALAKKHGYEAFPTQSAPVELIAGQTIRLRFVLHKTD
jgi:protocatechuate 3,4-dioxygenase beta subunit